jgi:hypothetical protein
MMMKHWVRGVLRLGIASAVVGLGPLPVRADEAVGDRWSAEESGGDGGDDATILALGEAGEFSRGLARQPAPAPERSRPAIRRMRPNTISLGVQASYGTVKGNSRIAEGFDNGPAYAFRFRYMLSGSAALGFSFEHQRFGPINPPSNAGEFADSHLVITTVSVEGVFYVHRERDGHPYFLGGLGIATPDIIFTEGQSSRANEGIFAVGGIGFERFVRTRFSLDLSIRGYALVSNAQFTSVGEIGFGIHLYPGD